VLAEACWDPGVDPYDFKQGGYGAHLQARYGPDWVNNIILLTRYEYGLRAASWLLCGTFLASAIKSAKAWDTGYLHCSISSKAKVYRESPADTHLLMIAS
jgi:hypothetical protein